MFCLFVCVCILFCFVFFKSYRRVILLSVRPCVLDNLQLGLVEAHEAQVEAGEETRLEKILVRMHYFLFGEMVKKER